MDTVELLWCLMPSSVVFFYRMKHLAFIIFFIFQSIVPFWKGCLLSVIKNKLRGCFMKKSYISSWTAHAKGHYSMDQKGIFRSIMQHVAVIVVYVTTNLRSCLVLPSTVIFIAELSTLLLFLSFSVFFKHRVIYIFNQHFLHSQRSFFKL